METEYEATFANINKEEIREKLKKFGAKQIKPELLMKRIVFTPPNKKALGSIWLRIRDEGDKVTMSIKKALDNKKIEDQKETYLEINDFEQAKNFLLELGCQQKAYQETKREVWELDGVEICIDEWPYLEPFVEVEGKNEKEVKKVSEKIGFDYSQALFCAVGYLYHLKYGVPEQYVNSDIKRITFNDPSPFLK